MDEVYDEAHAIEIDDLPSWASFHNEIKVWWALLDTLHVDEPAKMALFNLAQRGREGYTRANELVGKLIKKLNDQQPLGNPSGFVFSSVLNASHKMTDNQ